MSEPTGFKRLYRFQAVVNSETTLKADAVEGASQVKVVFDQQGKSKAEGLVEAAAVGELADGVRRAVDISREQSPYALADVRAQGVLRPAGSTLALTLQPARDDYHVVVKDDDNNLLHIWGVGSDGLEKMAAFFEQLAQALGAGGQSPDVDEPVGPRQRLSALADGPAEPLEAPEHQEA